MFIYERKANYHETDQMGYIHHSNYVKYMEEARVEFFDKMGWPYKEMEEKGLFSPVVAIDIQYKNPTKFGDTVLVCLKVTEYTGVKMEFSYEIKNKETGVINAICTSKHCFLENSKVVSLKKAMPEFHEEFMKLLEEK